MSNPPSGAMRAFGESDRSPEFVFARQHLIETTQDFLSDMLARRDGGTPLADGTIITDKSRVTVTDMGPQGGTNLRTSVEERAFGVSLTGDDAGKPLVLQAYRADGLHGEQETIEVKGMDPIAQQVHEGVFSLDRQQEEVIKFGVRSQAAGNPEQSFGFVVNGSGAVKRNFIDEHGVNVIKPLSSPDEIALAQNALEEIIGSF